MQDFEKHFSMLAHGISFVSYNVHHLPNPFVTFCASGFRYRLSAGRYGIARCKSTATSMSTRSHLKALIRGPSLLDAQRGQRRKLHSTAARGTAVSDHDPPDGQSFVLRVVENINDFTEDEWNSIAGTSRQEQNYNPFISRAFLAALEQSGCVSRKAGWLPRHLRLEDDQGNLIGAVPNYLKGHSQGEYVFDHGWADAFERAGGRYYPKFQAAVPFYPATGPRLLNHIAYDNHAVRLALAGGLRELADQSGVSSAHVTFAPADEIPALEKSWLSSPDRPAIPFYKQRLFIL